MRKLLELPLTLLYVVRVLHILPRIESARRLGGPREFVAAVRRGNKAARHSAYSRRCLCRAICWVDASCADGGNCYRRALLLMALYPEAAHSPLNMGFSLKERDLSGHAWLETAEPNADRYDFVIQL